MSALEKLIWNVLGYAAMPVIFLIGFIGVAVFTCLVLLWLDTSKQTSRWFVDPDQAGR
ncbi:TIGR02808 family protein [Zobellella aerophila]|uniref:TIGR02808 family protein n=1 Tax=Zobellella aerophila TaxID=870480 RepID=A0ABP6V3B0_9GAMM